MNTTELMLFFRSKYPELYIKMCETVHSDENYTSPHHLEGSVMTHTELVLFNYIKEDASNTLKVAALLHDIGKVYTKTINDNGKIVFYNHEKRGSIEAIDIVKDLCNEFDYIIFEDVIKLINLHHIFFNCLSGNCTDKAINKIVSKLNGFSPFFIDTLCELCIADSMGRYTLYDKSEDINKLKNLINTVKLRIEDANVNFSETDKKYPTITVLIGLPYSGKTTYINNNNIEYINYNRLSRDDVLMGMRKDSIMTYNEAWNTVNQNDVNKVFDEVMKYLYDEKINVIVDKTNMSVKSRNKVLGSLPKCYTRKAVVFLTGKKDINDRKNKRTDKVISSDIINNMSNSFSIPTYNEFDEIEYII